MKFYEASATIAAPPDAIWAILTDAPGYSEWDSGVRDVEGTIAPGEKITAVSEANPGRSFPVKVTQFEPGRAMTRAERGSGQLRRSSGRRSDGHAGLECSAGHPDGV
jgi:hypothetical protein